jgi:hypothetical protein
VGIVVVVGAGAYLGSAPSTGGGSGGGSQPALEEPPSDPTISPNVPREEPPPDPPGRWSGTISFEESTLSTSAGEAPFGRGGHRVEETSSTRADVLVTGTLSDHSGGGNSVASLKARISGTYERQKTFAGWTLESCGAVKNRKMNNTSQESSKGSAEGEATVTVALSADGNYVLGATSDVTIPVEGTFTGALEVFRAGCAVETTTNERNDAPLTQVIDQMLRGAGKVDPNHPYVLMGSTTEEDTPEVAEAGATSRRRTITTWNLRRN